MCKPQSTVACAFIEHDSVIERCIGEEYICNGFNDCPHSISSDEYGCHYQGIT